MSDLRNIPTFGGPDKIFDKTKGHESEKFYFLENISTHLFVIKIVISLVKVPFFKRQNRGVHKGQLN